MAKCGVLFEVRTEFLNNIWTSFGFRGLISNTDKNILWSVVFLSKHKQYIMSVKVRFMTLCLLTDIRKKIQCSFYSSLNFSRM
jgi:hypothetical protein